MGPDGIGLIFPNGLSLDGGLQMLWPVLVVVVGMAAYAVFVFKFYRFVASRDMFGLDLSKNDRMRDAIAWDLIFLVWYVVRYVILFPAFAFFWFAVLTLILVFLSENRDLSDILLIAMATVSAIRVSAYYNEELSRDLAKILPFAVLGVFIIDTTFFNIETSLDTLNEINQHRETIAYYLIYLVALEFGLRFLFVVLKLLFPGKRESQETALPTATQTPLPSQEVGNAAGPGANGINGRDVGTGDPDAQDEGARAGQSPA